MALQYARGDTLRLRVGLEHPISALSIVPDVRWDERIHGTAENSSSWLKTSTSVCFYTKDVNALDDPKHLFAINGVDVELTSINWVGA